MSKRPDRASAKREGSAMRMPAPDAKREEREDAAAPTRRVRLATTLQSLPDTDRLILSLYLLEGLSVLEIAGALKLSARVIEQRRVSALATIAREIGRDAGGRRVA